MLDRAIRMATRPGERWSVIHAAKGGGEARIAVRGFAGAPMGLVVEVIVRVPERPARPTEEATVALARHLRAAVSAERERGQAAVEQALRPSWWKRLWARLVRAARS